MDISGLAQLYERFDKVEGFITQNIWRATHKGYIIFLHVQGEMIILIMLEISCELAKELRYERQKSEYSFESTEQTKKKV